MNKSEALVFEDLKRRGFAVSSPRPCETANGIDLVAMKDGVAVTIEVKPVVCGKKSKTVKPLCRSGLHCDWIALVYKEQVIYQPMSEHKKLCGKTGSRGVTELIKLREMILAGVETGDVKT